MIRIVTAAFSRVDRISRPWQQKVLRG